MILLLKHEILMKLYICRKGVGKGERNRQAVFVGSWFGRFSIIILLTKSSHKNRSLIILILNNGAKTHRRSRSVIGKFYWFYVWMFPVCNCECVCVCEGVRIFQRNFKIKKKNV